MKQKIWLNWDLGINGDYDGLYMWLDKHKAKSCGDAFAVVEFEAEFSPMADSLYASLINAVTLRKTDVIYAVYKEGNSIIGKFIYGSRKRGDWFGCSDRIDDSDDIGE